MWAYTVQTIDPIELWRALRFPQECTEEVTRRGISEPCEKTAVAIREDANYGSYYPVCARHARAPMVPLAAIIRETRHDVG